jgi:hypothetical protein
MGMAEIAGEIREVELRDGWSEPGDELIITQIDNHKIFVQLKSHNPTNDA